MPDRFHFDRDGRLHLAGVPISAAGISAYRGHEIENFEGLGLDGDQTYRLLRPASELKRAAATFAGLPVMARHISAASASYPRELVVGAITDAKFLDPYLVGNISVWARSAIDGITNGTKCELSCGTQFGIDQTPGWFRTGRYHGVLRNITGHHLALCRVGRVPGCRIKLNMEEPDGLRFKVA